MKKLWVVDKTDNDVSELTGNVTISELAAQMLYNRGVRTPVQLHAFMSAEDTCIYIYTQFPQMEKLIRKLIYDIGLKNHIRIIGDYDIDGIFATYILYKGLSECGANVDCQLPNRMTDGYGLNMSMIDKAITDGVNTIITCDNGIAAIEQINKANENGIDVLITDHHEVSCEIKNDVATYSIPAAYAIVDPMMPDTLDSYKEICGTHVAFKVITALYDALGKPRSKLIDFIQFSAFATVGDVMPLTGENRTLVKLGLEDLTHTDNPGLAALKVLQQINGKEIEPHHIGFILGPCINAEGRLNEPDVALKLLLADDSDEAMHYAKDCVEQNSKRRSLTDAGIEDALSIATTTLKDDNVLIIYLPDCHEGVAGIVASKVKDEVGKPTFILTSSMGLVKGSGRSIVQYNLYTEMAKVADLFENYGGHVLTAGFTIKKENVNELRRRLNENCKLTETDLRASVHADAIITVPDVCKSFADELTKFEPFGAGNSKPTFVIKNVHLVTSWVVGANKSVLNCTLEDTAHNKMKAIYFGDRAADVQQGMKGHVLAVIGNISVSTYNGEVQFVIKGIKFLDE